MYITVTAHACIAAITAFVSFFIAGIIAKSAYNRIVPTDGLGLLASMHPNAKQARSFPGLLVLRGGDEREARETRLRYHGVR